MEAKTLCREECAVLYGGKPESFPAPPDEESPDEENELLSYHPMPRGVILPGKKRVRRKNFLKTCEMRSQDEDTIYKQQNSD
jgi:hypothetical protein